MSGTIDGKETQGSVPGDLGVAQQTQESQDAADARDTATADKLKMDSAAAAASSSDAQGFEQGARNTLFFSWNSKNPHTGALKAALRAAAANVGLAYDESTQDEAGSPNIVDTILKKIASASVFVADITPVAQLPESNEGVMNTNVAIEYGYARAKLHHSRVILLVNKDSVAQHAFDVRTQRYSPVNPKDPKLVDMLTNYVRSSVHQGRDEIVRIVVAALSRTDLHNPPDVRNPVVRFWT